MKFHILFTSILFFLFFSLNAQDEEVIIKSSQVSESIWVLSGGGGNIAVLKGESGLILVDDKFEEHFEKIERELSKISSEKISYVINTHFHYDHTDGNKSFGKPGTTIIAHQNARNRLLNDNTILFPGSEPFYQKKLPAQALPKETFLTEMSLFFDQHTIKLHHLPNAHTDGDLVVVFTNENVIHCGDVFVRYGIPFIDLKNGASVKGFIKALDKIIELGNENTKIIPGHGEVCSIKEVSAHRDKLSYIYQTVKSDIQKGKSLNDILEANYFEGYFPDSFIPVDFFVEMVYNEISGSN